jgi:ribosomal protein S18 acetylase RimI-like enzyme
VTTSRAEPARTTIRRAGSGDLDTLRRLWEEYAVEVAEYRTAAWPWTWDDVAPRLEQGAAFLAEVDGAPAGFLIASRSRPDIGHVDDVYVLPQYRRRGVATALVHHLAAAFRERGVEHVALDVDQGNVAAQRLYERLGFRPYATRLAAEVSIMDGP